MHTYEFQNKSATNIPIIRSTDGNFLIFPSISAVSGTKGVSFGVTKISASSLGVVWNSYFFSPTQSPEELPTYQGFAIRDAIVFSEKIYVCGYTFLQDSSNSSNQHYHIRGFIARFEEDNPIDADWIVEYDSVESFNSLIQGSEGLIVCGTGTMDTVHYGDPQQDSFDQYKHGIIMLVQFDSGDLIWGHKLRGTNLHSHFTSYEQIIRVDNEDVEEYALIGYCGLDGNTQDPIDEYSDILLTTIDIGGTITESTRVEFPISNTYYNIYGASIVSHGDEFGIIANWRNEANGTQIAVANLNYPDFTANWFDTLSLCNFNGCQEGIQNARRIIFNEGYYHIVGYANIDLIFANHWIEGFKIVLNPINGSIVTARVYGDIARYDTILGIIPYNSSTMLMTGYTDYWNPGTTSPWLIKVHNQPINDCLEHPVYPLSGAIDVNYEAMEGYQFNPGSSSILIAYQSQNPIADSICFSGKRDNLEKAQKSISAILNPNPTEDYVTIISDRKMISLEIFDMAGKLLKTTAVNNTEATIDVRNYSKGVYFMRIQGENSAVTRKVTVE